MVKQNRLNRGFSLTELLVVIAIIAITTAILFPVLTKAREKARQGSCMNNLRQISVGMSVYSTEHEDLLPTTANWNKQFTNNAKILTCPSAPTINVGYAYNANLSGKDLAHIAKPSETMLAIDGGHNINIDTNWAKGLEAWYSADTGVQDNGNGKVISWAPRTPPYSDGTNLTSGYYQSSDAVLRHDEKACMSFVDGHVEMLAQVPDNGDIAAGSTFIQNDIAKAPTFKASGINGQESIHFDTNAGTFLQTTAGVGMAASPINFNRGDMTIIMVRNMGVDTYATVLATPGFVLRGGEIMAKVNGSTDYVEGLFPEQTTNKHIVFVTMKQYGTGYKIGVRYNSDDYQSGFALATKSSLNGITPLILGNDPLNWPTMSCPATMDVAELLVYNRVLTNSEMNTVYSMFRTKYGI